MITNLLSNFVDKKTFWGYINLELNSTKENLENILNELRNTLYNTVLSSLIRKIVYNRI